MHSATKWIVAIGLAFGMAGCQTTGGIIGGLIPAPKMTQGELSNGRYTAKDQTFSVDSPFATDSIAYTYMSITEDYQEGEDHIIFASSAAPAEVYRVDVIKQARNEPALRELILSKYKEVFESSYKAPMQLQGNEPVSISGLDSTASSFVQEIPERRSGGQVAHGFTALFTYYYLERNGNAYAILVNRAAPGDAGFAEGAEGRISKFIRSFQAN